MRFSQQRFRGNQVFKRLWDMCHGNGFAAHQPTHFVFDRLGIANALRKEDGESGIISPGQTGVITPNIQLQRASSPFVDRILTGYGQMGRGIRIVPCD